MAKDGTISGRVLDAEQNGVAKTEVSIRQGKMEVAKTVTDADGRFEIANVKGGVYVVAANSGYGLFRFWTAKSAPPKSHEKVLLMSNSVVVRAQNANDGGEVLYDDNGQPYAKIHVVDHGRGRDRPSWPSSRSRSRKFGYLHHRPAGHRSGWFGSRDHRSRRRRSGSGVAVIGLESAFHKS